MPRLLLSLILSILALAALAGCGDGSAKSSAATPKHPASARALIEKNARAVITDSNQTCRLLTDAALAVYAGSRTVKDPLGACYRQVKRGHLPKTARINVFDISGHVARVGYVTSQVSGLMIFVLQDGDWLMNGVTTIRN